MTEINNECDGSKYIFSLFPFTILMQIDVFASHECMIHFQSSFFCIWNIKDLMTEKQQHPGLLQSKFKSFNLQ